MFHVRSAFLKLGETSQDAIPARLLCETEDLTRHFRYVFGRNAERFRDEIRLEGMPPVKFEFTAICPTVAKIVVPSFLPKEENPDAICLLVNGLEERHDIEAVKAQVQLPDLAWQVLEGEEKPVAFNVFLVNGRIREAATITVLSVLANVYFAMFGTNQVDDD